MASLHVTEFRGVAAGAGGPINAPYGYITTQEITIGSEVDTAALNAATRLVRCWAEAACHICWGAAEQAASTAKMPLGAGESFTFAVDGTDEISVIAA